MRWIFRKVRNSYFEASAVFLVLRHGIVLIRHILQHAEDDKLTVGFVSIFRKAKYADLLETVREHARDTAVQPSLRDQINQDPPGAEIWSAVAQKCPLIPFRLLDVIVTGCPVIRRIEPKQAE